MANKHLTWIKDEDLYRAIEHVYGVYKDAVKNTDLTALTRNVISPFTFLFETGLAKDVSIEEWVAGEAKRQIAKTLGNAVGEFHQMVLGAVDGWENLGTGHATGLDLMKSDRTIFAEIKNKYNTLTGTHQAGVFNKLEQTAEDNPGAVCYFVHMVRNTKRPYDKVWIVSRRRHPRVRLISGEKFYEKVVGRGSLTQLLEILPGAIDELIPSEEKVEFESEISAVSELKEAVAGNLSVKNTLLYLTELAYRNSEDSANQLSLLDTFDSSVD